MSTDAKDILARHIDGVADNLEAFAVQIETGQFVTRELEACLDHLFGDPYLEAVIERFKIDRESVVDIDGEIDADAVELELEGMDLEAESGTIWRLVEHDEPTVDDLALSEYGIEIVVAVGEPFRFVICTGGPHIEIERSGYGYGAQLVGHWGGEKIIRHSRHFDTVLDYVIEPMVESLGQ